MITKEALQEEIESLSRPFSKNGSVGLDKDGIKAYNKAVKRVNKLREYINTISLPNAEERLLSSRQQLKQQIAIIEERWKSVVNTYRISNNPNATLAQRQSHHNAQYKYNDLKRKLKQIEEILNG
jgi:tRNA G10  N-methylase Trm11